MSAAVGFRFRFWEILEDAARAAGERRKPYTEEDWPADDGHHYWEFRWGERYGEDSELLCDARLRFRCVTDHRFPTENPDAEWVLVPSEEILAEERRRKAELEEEQEDPCVERGHLLKLIVAASPYFHCVRDACGFEGRVARPGDVLETNEAVVPQGGIAAEDMVQAEEAEERTDAEDEVRMVQGGDEVLEPGQGREDVLGRLPDETGGVGGGRPGAEEEDSGGGKGGPRSGLPRTLADLWGQLAAPELLKEVRKARGLTQRQLAEAMGGVSQSDVSRAEKGTKAFDRQRLMVAASALGLPAQAFVDPGWAP